MRRDRAKYIQGLLHANGLVVAIDGVWGKRSQAGIVPAYPLFYAGQEVSSIRVHRLCADAFLAVFEDILAFYGADRIRELGLDQYSGTYNKRRIRGGRSWSTHAFGIAIDLFAAMNRMRMSFKESLFSKAEYAEFMNIWRRHGFVNLGEALDFDSMHMQWASV